MTASLTTRLSQDLDGAFPALVDAFGSMVATLSARLTDPITGEDITQDTFLRAYRALERYEPQQVAELDLRPWLATITRNLVRNEYRRQSRRPTTPIPLDVGLGSEPVRGHTTGRGNGDRATTGDPSATAEIHDELERLDRLLARLTDPQREAVVLRHIVGMPIREIATSLGCPEGTVKSHISRGMATLRTALAPDGSTTPSAETEGSAAASRKEEA